MSMTTGDLIIVRCYVPKIGGQVFLGGKVFLRGGGRRYLVKCNFCLENSIPYVGKIKMTVGEYKSIPSGATGR
jgi:hypothetical protein